MASTHPEKVVLVVDDEAPFRQMMEEAVRGAGFSVSTAASGKAALSAIEKRRPGLILLDLRLGADEMDGISVLERIHQMDAELPGHSVNMIYSLKLYGICDIMPATC